MDRQNQTSSKNQRGLATAEFAIVGGLFFTVLFGVIEIGRLFFVLESLSEVTRRSARVAAICPIGHSAIKRVGIFNAASNSSTNSPVIYGLNESHLSVDYLDINGNTVGSPGTNFAAIQYVRTAISGFQHRLIIPGLNVTVTAPDFETVIPRESLGVVPDTGTACFGTAG